ncbi:MAG: DUF922 domain-containing protein [Winogradskyella sp.]
MPIKSVVVFCFLLLFAQSKEETLTWSASQKLTWADFKAKPNLNSNAVAITASGITFAYSAKTLNNKIVSFTTTVNSHFYPNKSWCKKKKANNYILAHEQLHFDITELYARKFKQQLAKLTVNQNIKTQLNNLHQSITKGLNTTQKKYDAQSKHSINVEAQKQWEAFIKAELETLDDFN